MNRTAHLGMMVTLALIFSYIEVLIPIQLPIPGVKLGLANIVIVVVLYKWGFKEAFLVSTIRVIIAGFLFGNPMMILYSLAGCTLSIIAMSLIYKRNSFSIMGVSILGAIFHNIGQTLVAIIVLESFSIIYYSAILLMSALITGLIIGILAQQLMRMMKGIRD
ncbi:heptaprenyl diphosphate synthase [Candidatus Epulonipiscium fishelsonii]|uniref:Heptaprenyl diphosphate synthase n=1 Tax=Candidatus Epulonipiscium fishelsonii TaxID=77094 RepID=A0ACC8XBQ1_9FIRM|nr:heptaprenyl diphosphate synthase [Epulopiscium sp. SCG-B05WGA-EpuloA1]ONI39995.1 heptaprenyl diphosphate synthase [Epulopiscium sp. SCG-B11WGA-EpuloA1]